MNARSDRGVAVVWLGGVATLAVVLTAGSSRAQTRCLYDVLAPPGELRRFQSAIDLTGGSGVCPSAVCDAGSCVEAPCGAARAVNFPDGFGSLPGVGARLDEVCLPGATYVRPPIPNLVIPSCSGPRCYSLTRVGVTPSLGCAWFSPPTLPATYGPANSPCAVSASYTAVTARAVYKPGGNLILKNVDVGATSCPGAVSAESVSPTGAPEVFGAALPVGTGVGQWQNVGALNGASCRSGSPCELFLSSASPTSVLTGRSWYAFFDNTFLPATSATSPSTVPSYQLRTASGPAVYVDGVLTGSVSQPDSVPCAMTRRYAAGETLASFGVLDALSQLDASALSRGARANESPTRLGRDFTCTGAFPCDVTLANDTPLSPGWTPAGAIFNPAGPPAVPSSTQQFSAGTTLLMPTTSNSYTMRVTNPVTYPACPALGASTVNPVLPDVVWTTGAPTGCGMGQASCQFSMPTSGMAVAAAGECVSPLSKFNAAPVGLCAFNGKPYGPPTNSPTNPSGTPYRAVVRIPSGWPCRTGTFLVSSITADIIPDYPTLSTNIPAGQVGFAPNQASLTFLGDLPGSSEMTTGVDLTSPPSGYPPVPTGRTARGSRTRPPGSGTVVFGAPSEPMGGCLGPVSSDVQSSDTVLCAGQVPCTLSVVGPVVVSSLCGPTGSQPCYTCEYQPLTFTWTRATKDCSYGAQRSDFGVERTARTCTYSRPQWNIETTSPMHACRYRLGARRYDFQQPSQATCPYFAVQHTIASTSAATFTYEYLTRGTELIGRATTAPLPDGLCGTRWASGTALGTACPETLPGCAGLAAVTPALQGADLSRATCRLKWGGPESDGVDDFLTWFTTAGRADGRAAGFIDAGLAFMGLGVDHRSCEAAAPIDSPATYQPSDGGVRGFCSQTAAVALDAGLMDAGSTDGGPPEAGLNAGGFLPDAGLDSGPPIPGEYAVGCSCGHGGLGGAWLGAVLLVARKRRTQGSRTTV